METQLRHIVCFKFRDGVSDADRQQLEEDFCALVDKIPQVSDLEWGTNFSKESFDKGLTHCFILTFAGEKELAEYIAHPAHEQFVKQIQKHTGDLLVLDYWKKGALFPDGAPTV